MRRAAALLVLFAALAGCTAREARHDAEVAGEDALVGAAWFANILSQARDQVQAGP